MRCSDKFLLYFIYFYFEVSQMSQEPIGVQLVLGSNTPRVATWERGLLVFPLCDPLTKVYRCWTFGKFKQIRKINLEVLLILVPISGQMSRYESISYVCLLE